MEDIDHTRTKARSPQTNGIVERFHKTMLDEFYRIAFRKKVYATIDEFQADLDAWMREFNEIRPAARTSPETADASRPRNPSQS